METVKEKTLTKKTNELRACLFDLDGVIFDTEPQYTVFWGSQCRLYHPEHPGLEHEIKGSTLDQIFGLWWSGPLESERPKVVERLDAFEAQMALNYVPGFESFVKDLRKHGIMTAVVTSSNRQKMLSVYRKHPDFTSLFDAVLTSEDFTESKPSPQCYLAAARRLGATPQECLVFEDSINGLRAGKAATMGVIGMTTTNTRERIAEYSNYMMNDFKDIDNEKLQLIWQDI